MKNLVILVALFLGIAVIYPSSVNAQGCGGSGMKSSCSKSCKGESKSCAPATSTTTTGSIKGTMKVSGKCEMCKTRIEAAAKSVNGVMSADWNQSTKILTYTSKVAIKKEDVSKAMIKVGHDTEMGKATASTYNALPDCCKYR